MRYFTDRRETKELPRRGVSGTGVNAYGDAGPLLSPTCQGHRDYNGGGKPPPPTVLPLQHAGALESAEWAAYFHRSVRQGGG